MKVHLNTYARDTSRRQRKRSPDEHWKKNSCAGWMYFGQEKNEIQNMAESCKLPLEQRMQAFHMNDESFVLHVCARFQKTSIAYHTIALSIECVNLRRKWVILSAFESGSANKEAKKKIHVPITHVERQIIFGLAQTHTTVECRSHVCRSIRPTFISNTAQYSPSRFIVAKLFFFSKSFYASIQIDVGQNKCTRRS